jgi:hypothetical protein
MLLVCEPFPSVMDKVTSFTLSSGEGIPSIYPLVLSYLLACMNYSGTFSRLILLEGPL